jgi:hypothetical protein
MSRRARSYTFKYIGLLIAPIRELWTIKTFDNMNLGKSED